MEAEQYFAAHFSRIKLLHQGKATEIWLVRDNAGKRYVWKIIARTGLPYPQMVGIKHPNLPLIGYAVEEDGKTYVAEEYLSGQDMRRFIEGRGEQDEGTVRRMAIGLADCLKMLHERHILHRDIKPSNLFFTDDGQVKLIDFDAGRIEKPDQEYDTQIIGTPGFASPEQYGYQATDERSDIYSLGLTLKMCLGQNVYFPFMSPIINKCTEFDPQNRFQNMGELLTALQYGLHRPWTWADTKREWLRKSKQMFWLLLAGVGCYVSKLQTLTGFLLLVMFLYVLWDAFLRAVVRVFYRYKIMEWDEQMKIYVQTRPYPKLLQIDGKDPWR